MKLILILLLSLGFVGVGESTESGSQCDQAMVAKVEEATSGMDLTSLMLVSQTAGSALQATDAKLAHQGQAATQGTLSTVAMKRYAECSAAISECEGVCTKCPKWEKVESDRQTACAMEAMAGGGECSQLTQEAEEEKNKCEGFLRECTSFSEKCNSTALQGLLSAIQAAISALAAKKLGDCKEGEDCDEESSGKPKEETLVAGPNPPPSIPGLPGQGPWGISEFTGNEPGLSGKYQLPPGGQKQPGKNIKTTKNTRNNNNPNGNDNPGLTPLPLGSGKDDPSSGSPSSLAGNMGSSLGDFGSNFGLGEEEEEEEDPENEKYPSDLTAGFTGGGSTGGSNGASGYRSHSSARGGGPKLALNSKKFGKKGDLKGNIFNKKTEDSIFKKMSRLIQSFCAKGAGKCQK